MLYTAGSQGVSRIDPVTGAASILISPGSNWEPHSINFNVGFTKLYIGTVEWANQGRVYGVELDANLDPILSTLQVFASGVGEGWHDGVEVDICGYVYIPDYWTSRLYRIHPDGTPEVFVDWSWDTNQYAHGALFGNGVGGFREDALYVPMPYNGNTVKEIVVGVPRRDWAGIALNAP